LTQGCTPKEETSQKTTTPTIATEIPNTTPPEPSTETEVSTDAIFSHAKTMKLPTLKGKAIMIKAQDNLLKVTNPKFKGKETLLYLFGRDCPYCVKIIPTIKKLAKRKELRLIGIHAQKEIGDAKLKRYMKKIGYDFDILSFQNDIELLRFLKKNALWDGGVPVAILIDKGGNLRVVDPASL
jgi:thiol-disulfide isomerase/thioredoxin